MTHTLSEYESKRLVAPYGVPVADEHLVDTAPAAAKAAAKLGFPVVAKLCGAGIAHKTERGLVRLGLADAEAVESAAADLLAAATSDDGEVGVLVAPQARASRELIVGGIVDAQFGPAVLLGVGGVLAEVAGGAVLRPVPLDESGARGLIEDLGQGALLGAVRGEDPVDAEALAAVLVGISDLLIDRPDVRSVDVNPLAVTPDGLLALDALVEVDDAQALRH